MRKIARSFRQNESFAFNTRSWPMAPSDLYRLKSLTQAPLYSPKCLSDISKRSLKNSSGAEQLQAEPSAGRNHISSRPESLLSLQLRRWSVNTDPHSQYSAFQNRPQRRAEKDLS